MSSKSALAGEIQATITREFLIALKLSPDKWFGRSLAPILGLATGKFAHLAAEFDRRLLESGLADAMAWFLSHYVNAVEVRGAAHVPLSGPLILASNHPGAYDGVCILANCPRDDVDVVVSDIPFTHAFPSFSQHLIYVSSAIQQRWMAVREMVRRLRLGRAVLIFASGLVDPDPDLEPGASSALDAWSRSLELAMCQAPGTRLVPVTVSGVLAKASLQNPLTRLARIPWERRKLAEFLQVAQQLAFGRDYHLKPRLSFGVSLGLPETGRQELMPSIIAGAKEALTLHMAITED